jgi:hypothetical protein
MAAVAVAIVAALGLYTFFRLHYAKPGKPHEPYAESRARTDEQRLTAAGWTHGEAAFEPLAEVPETAGAARPLLQPPAAAGALALLTPGAWILPVEYPRLAAPATLGADEPYAVHFQARLDHARAQIVGFDLYRKDSDVLVVPRWEQMPDGLVPRERPVSGRLVWPAGAVPAGQYRVTLLAVKESAQWDLAVVPRTPAPPAAAAAGGR